jgi:hypothetical protein
MSTVTASFTATGNGNALYVQPGETFNYVVTGTADGVVQLEYTEGGSAYVVAVADIADAAGTYASGGTLTNSGSAPRSYRFRCSTFTSGTIVAALTDITAATERETVVVDVATTANGTITTAFDNGSTVDGVTLTTNMRILIKDQTDATVNGIYTVNGSGSPTRVTSIEHANVLVVVAQGTANAETLWKCTNDTVALGTDSLTFSKIGAPGTPVTCTAATLTVTAAEHNGKLIVLSKVDGQAVTLPAATGSGATFRFRIGLTITSVGTTIKVVGNDTMKGLALGLDGDGVPANAWAISGTDDTITLDGSTTGGVVGDLIVLEDMAADIWAASIFIQQSGTEATPMSATVS